MKTLVSLLFTSLLVVSCGNSQSADQSSLHEVHAENLWVSDASWNAERYLPNGDPCYGARSLNGQEASFLSWARQRAGYTNVCLQVWKPGVTDQENPDFWRLLDVKLHYRWVGGDQTWKEQAINAVDRVGNNRRYIWNMRERDAFGYNDGNEDAHITVIDEYPDRGQIFGEATLEFYFSVNGNGLGNHDATPYRIKYAGYKSIR